MTGHADVHSVRVRRIDENLYDALGLLEPHVRPVVAAVRGLVDAVAHGDAVARPRFTRADPDRFRIGGIDRDGADGLHGLFVEHWFVRGAAVGGLPHAATGGAGVYGEASVLARRRDRRDASAHRRRADVPRTKSRRGIGVD